MKKRFLPNLLLYIGFPLFFLTSCVNDKELIIPPPITDQSFVEEFDTVSAAFNRGWTLRNTSVPMISNVWQQGGDVNPLFAPYSSSGSYAGFIGINGFVSNPVIGNISEWLISPLITLQNGDKIIFYTRSWLVPDGTGDSTDYGNRLQLRLSVNSESINVGQGGENGDFTTPLLDINPTYLIASLAAPEPNAYPGGWTRFEATVYGLQKPVLGRFAFKYYIEDGNNFGSGVGIDKVTYQSVSRP